MLIIKRKSGESLFLMLGDGREIVIHLQIPRDRSLAKLAIEAPPSVRVWRDEALDDIRARSQRDEALA
jgi:sRNA-binding carbon storage regulator CsrA